METLTLLQHFFSPRASATVRQTEHFLSALLCLRVSWNQRQLGEEVREWVLRESDADAHEIWIVRAQDGSLTPGSMRAHIRFVGEVCQRFEPSMQDSEG